MTMISIRENVIEMLSLGLFLHMPTEVQCDK